MNAMPRIAVGSREDILNRIAEVLGTIAGVKDSARNRAGYTQDRLPAVIVLDGSESIISNVPPLKTVQMTPAIMLLKPEIFVILPQRDDVTNTTLNGVYQPIGPELSFWRDAVLNTLINDATLIQLLSTSGQITYRGCSTDMATGRTMWGQLQLMIDFQYVWFPPLA